MTVGIDHFIVSHPFGMAALTAQMNGTGLQFPLNSERIADFAARFMADKDALLAEHRRAIAEEVHINAFARHNEIAAAGLGKNKNRYVNSPLFDRGVIVLQRGEKEKDSDYDGNSDYINASRFVSKKLGEYVLTQAPTDDTLVDFYRMVTQTKARVIVCLNATLDESDSFTPYFDPRLKKKFKVGSRFRVRTLSVDQRDCTTTYKLELKDNLLPSKESISEITVVHVAGWEADEPFEPTRLVKAVRAVEVVDKDNGDKMPIIVHGSSGIRRTGCFVITSLCYREIHKCKTVSLFEHVSALRQNRYGVLVQKSKFCLVLAATLQMATTNRLVAPDLLAQAIRVLTMLDRRLNAAPKSAEKIKGSAEGKKKGKGKK